MTTLRIEIVSDPVCPWCYIGKRRREGARSPNTLGAHMLMDLASDTPGCDTSTLAEALFHAHHVDCADLGDAAVLSRLGIDAGLDAETLRVALADTERENRVREQMEQAAERGVSGVPFFIFNDRYAVSGAQPADAFADLITRLSATG